MWCYFKYRTTNCDFSLYSLILIIDDGTEIKSKTVVLTTGTFLKATINIGLESKPAGRLGDEPAIGYYFNTLRSILKLYNLIF